jgi:hypothetical protein
MLCHVKCHTAWNGSQFYGAILTIRAVSLCITRQTT